MRVSNLFSLLTSSHVRMHHFADDRARPNNGHLHNYVVKPIRLIARQGSHLCAALYLEHADRICSLQGLIDLLVFRQLRKVFPNAILFRDDFQAVFDDGHHS